MELPTPQAALLLLLLATGAQAQRGFFDFGFFGQQPNRGDDLPPGRGGLDHEPGSTQTGTNTGFLGTNFINYFGSRPYSIRLVGGSNSREGNVEVLIFDGFDFFNQYRSVCDIGWNKKHAEAVCKQLGFPGNAVATKNGRFGFRSTGYGTILSNCQVGANGSGLINCLRRGQGATASCRSNNIAGVICGADPSTPPVNPKIDVRLRNGGATKGDVEVKYGNRGWAPVCGDGFDLKDATVVCKQLGLGAAKRSYISGRRASGAYILAGVECNGRETNLGQCKSIRGNPVRCPGNQYSGAAIECSGRANNRLPDLEVDAEALENSVYLRTETLGELSCALDEGCLANTAKQIQRDEPRLWRTRTRKLFTFTNKVWNNGQRDYRPKADPAEWIWHACHSHYHSEESFSEYDLTFVGTETKAAQGQKASFCLEDSDCKPGISKKYQCYIERGQRPPQGIRAGCADVYGAGIDCQWIDVTDIKSGDYVLRVRVNADRKVAEATFDNNQINCNVNLNLEQDTATATNCRVVPLDR